MGKFRNHLGLLAKLTCVSLLLVGCAENGEAGDPTVAATIALATLPPPLPTTKPVDPPPATSETTSSPTDFGETLNGFMYHEVDGVQRLCGGCSVTFMGATGNFVATSREDGSYTTTLPAGIYSIFNDCAGVPQAVSYPDFEVPIEPGDNSGNVYLASC